uniref:Cytosine permease n=1 Tax=Batrachochytrium dendrobatidis (strain JAM81 / FGSC 10211) TaxID=684364 RepID=F4PFS4_BATDJ|eukprot:XP_006683457.1 hypothetical protein BATDEDRAFT_28965 [Batrachochytrium dendrobatidis JAM81]
MSARQSLWSITIIRVGALATISQFILGASLGYGMTFWQAFWATMFGSVILQVISFLLGYAGAREGLSTSLLSRWTGFGRYGSSIIGGVIAISCVGWFGVQNSVFADGLVQATSGKLTLPVAATITGLSVTVLVIFGFKLLSITATITVPLFLLAVGFGIYQVLSDHSIIDLVSATPAGDALTMGAAATMVAGGFIIGAVITPDFSRFAKSGKDVFWMATIGVLIGELGINMIAVLMALAARTNDVVGVLVPPIAGIMVVEYFILKTHRKVLDETRKEGTLPSNIEKMHPITMIAWAAGFAAGYIVPLVVWSIILAR